MENEKIYYDVPQDCWGAAINSVTIDKEGKMWVSNDEYSSQVNFHPFTGEPAPYQMSITTNSTWENGTKYIGYDDK